jgi:hypothetical protein
VILILVILYSIATVPVLWIVAMRWLRARRNEIEEGYEDAKGFHRGKPDDGEEE